MGIYWGFVLALAAIGTDLYVGGNFISAGGKAANNIARWDRNNWYTLDTGVNSGVSALAAIGTDLYVGGSFTSTGGKAANYIAKWDGNSWNSLGDGVGGKGKCIINSCLPNVSALAVIGTDLYVGGNFTSAGGKTANYIARWDGTNWYPIIDSNGINGTNGPIFSIIIQEP